ncbi:MAG: crotonase/enoyl-CoA hydratase family protein [Nevskiaceae bacterium]|nr:MAG: crotonase/enoyl-CoA hydratase family protein [Nevskiaceae bacterium]TAM32911.1 MAG: crotonase/enoyl-CoA hydratase family protein [Nevskiaceae bacterium]
MEFPFVSSTWRAGVATLRFERPETRNAIASLEDCQQFAAAVEALAASAETRCLILTGAGSAFCAGGDLKALQERRGIGPMASPAETRTNYRRGVQRMIRALADCEVPVIAAVNGPAIGLGCDLAALADIRIAAESARFASTFINLGLIPGDGGAWILPRAVGWSRASEMILTGEVLDAGEALSCGLVSRVVADSELLAAAAALADKIAAKPAQAARLAKRLLREAQHQRLGDVLELSSAYQALAHESEDHREALAAYIDKRPPSFTGR